MRKLPLIGAFISLAAASTAEAQPVQVLAPLAGSTTIDFNSLGAYTPITNQYSGLGVTVSSSCFMSNPNPQYSTYFGGDPMQATNFDQNGQDCNGSLGFYPTVTFNFSAPISYFGLYGISNNNITLTDANGFISVFAPVVNPANFVGFTDITGGSWVTISADVNGAFVIDDVSFVGSSVPEPASIVLVGTGLVGVFGAARRRRDAHRTMA